MLKIILATLLGIVFAVPAWFGMFRPMKMRIEYLGGEQIIFREIKGDYRQSAAVMDEVYEWLRNHHKIETRRGFGLYYDNPQKVPVNKLRALAGCIIEPADTAKLPEDFENMKSGNLPLQRFIVTEFPYKNKMSVVFSIIKVYPSLRNYAKANDYPEDTPVIEIYDIPDHKIRYRKALTTDLMDG